MTALFDAAAVPPGLRPALRLQVQVTPPVSLGVTDGQERRIIAIAGGSVAGPGFTGTILPGGSDVQAVRSDGAIVLTARYAADCGEHGKLLIENTGIRRNGAGGADAAPYFRGIMRFTAASGPLAWLNESIFISTGYREGSTVHLDVFEVL